MTNNKFFQGLESLENGGVIADKVNDILESGYINETTKVEEFIAELDSLENADVSYIESVVDDIYNTYKSKVNYLFHDMSEMDFVEIPNDFVAVDMKALNRYLKKQPTKEWELIKEDYTIENFKVGFDITKGYYAGTDGNYGVISASLYDNITLAESEKNNRLERLYLDNSKSEDNCIEYTYEFDVYAEEGMEEYETTFLVCRNHKFPKVLKNIIADADIKKLFEDEKKEKVAKEPKVAKVQTGKNTSEEGKVKKQLTQAQLEELNDLEEL